MGFYDLFGDSFRTNKSKYNILVGDFNAKVGRDSDGNQGVGPGLTGNSNKNSDKLVNVNPQMNITSK